MKLFLALTVSAVLAASVNETVSEFGVALTYNSHLLDWEDGNDTSGVPAVQGYFYVLGDNSTDKNNTYIQPRWTVKNLLRICLQIFDVEEPEIREQVRWVLNYTDIEFAANFTPQVMIAEDAASEDPKEWCSLPHNDERIYDYKTYGADMVKKWEERDKKDPLVPYPYLGYTTTGQFVHRDQLYANLSFYRNMSLEDYPDSLQLNWENNTYKVLLNWGIFKDENDTSKDYIYGADTLDDALDWVLLQPTGAAALKAAALALVAGVVSLI